MSHQSKMSRKLAVARQLKMTKGPKSTTPCHGKTKSWYHKKNVDGKVSNNPVKMVRTPRKVTGQEAKSPSPT